MEVLTERQKRILTTIVENYFVHAKPVASTPLAESGAFPYSSPTIRNDMLKLEKMGYLVKLHASSGRIPSEKAYRLYVENLLLFPPRVVFPGVQRLARKWKKVESELRTFLTEALNTLAQEASAVAFASLPLLDSEEIQFLRITPFESTQILVSLRGASGWQETRLLYLPESVQEFRWEEISSELTDWLKGRRISTITPSFLNRMFSNVKEKVLLKAVLSSFFYSLQSSERFYHEGLWYLPAQPEFQASPEKVAKLLRLLEEPGDLIDILVGMEEKIGVVWESALRSIGLEGCVIVSQIYSPGGLRGFVGVAGPIRLNYPRVLPLLQSLSTTLAHHFHSMLISE